MGPDLDSLVTRLYVTVDDLLIRNPHWAPRRPAVGIAPQVSDAEMVTLAVIQVLLRFDTEARFLRHAHAHLKPWFPYLPARSGYNKRLRRSAEMLAHVIGWLARNSLSWTDELWLVDSTPVECGRSRQTARRSDLVGWAEYGFSASHSRYFWGLRLHLIATPSGMPIAFALAGAKADERDTALGMLDHAGLARHGQVLMADKGYRSAEFEGQLNEAGMILLRPATKAEQPRQGQKFLKPFRQTIESIYHTLKEQLGLERHHGRTPSVSPPGCYNASSPWLWSSGTTKPPTDPAQPAP